MVSANAPAGVPDRAEYETGAYKWYVAGVLCLAYMVSVVDRFVMVLVSEPVRGALHLTDMHWGCCRGPDFPCCTARSPSRWGIADITNRRNLIVIGLVVWSLATIALAGRF